MFKMQLLLDFAKSDLCVFCSVLHVLSHNQNGWSKDSGDAQLASLNKVLFTLCLLQYLCIDLLKLLNSACML